ncbi:hypothetical protein D3C85_1361010 [compost metagenome]
MNGNLAKSLNSVHPTQKLSGTTRKLLSDSVEALGGENKISDLARSNNLSPEQYLVNNSPIMQPLSRNPIRVTVDSPIEHIDQNINTLIQREIALVDLKTALPRNLANNFDFEQGILQTQKLIEANRGLRYYKMDQAGLPSYNLTVNASMNERFPSPPSYIDALRKK